MSTASHDLSPLGQLAPVGADQPEPRPQNTRDHGRVWAQDVEVAAAGLRIRLSAIEAREKLRDLSDAEFTAICDGVKGLLRRAEEAARGYYPRHYVFLSWWRGTNLEAAFQSLHRAEAELVRLYNDEEVDAEIPDAVGRTEVALNRDHPMREVARELSQMSAGSAKRILLSRVIQVGYESTDRSHSRIRNFRNILLVTTLLIAALVSIFSWVVYNTPTSVPLCFEPANSPANPPVNVPGTVLPSTVACPSGDGPGRAPASLDVAVVAMLGLLGGSLAAAVSIRNLRGTSTPYDIPIALALLKVPAGALTALGALIAIRGQFIPGLSALDTQEQILAYALVFGYAQQLLTRFIDRRALSLLDKVPSKDPAQSRPPLRSLPPIGPPATTGDGPVATTK